MTMTIRVIQYGPEHYTETICSTIQELKPFIENTQLMTWFNVEGVKDKKSLVPLYELLGIDTSELEESHTLDEKPKFDTQPNHGTLLALVAILEHKDHSNHVLKTEKVNLIFNDHFILSHHPQDTDFFKGIQKSLKEGKGSLRKENTLYLAYVILETIIDAYRPVVDRYADVIDLLEDKVIAHATNQTFLTIHGLKKQLALVKRYLWHFVEALQDLLDMPPEFMTEKDLSLFQKNYDHASQFLDVIENYKETTAGLVDLFFSSQGSKLNEIMKILTIVATIFTPLAYFTGVFGMNFYDDEPIWNPIQLHHYWGYLIFLGITIFTVYFMMRIFRKKGWLEADEPKLPSLSVKNNIKNK